MSQPLIVSNYWKSLTPSQGGKPHTKVEMIGMFSVNNKTLFKCPVEECQFHSHSGVEVSDLELQQGTLCCNGSTRYFEPKPQESYA